MAESFIMLTDSGSDLTKEMAEELQVQIMPLLYTLEGEDPRSCSRGKLQKPPLQIMKI